MTRDVRAYLDDIGDIHAIEEYTQGLTRAQFLSARLVQDAAIRRIEVIGEAARNVPQDARELRPEIRG